MARIIITFHGNKSKAQSKNNNIAGDLNMFHLPSYGEKSIKIHQS